MQKITEMGLRRNLGKKYTIGETERFAGTLQINEKGFYLHTEHGNKSINDGDEITRHVRIKGDIQFRPYRVELTG